MGGRSSSERLIHRGGGLEGGLGGVEVLLLVVEFFVEGAAGVEVGVGAGVDDGAVFEDEDLAGVLDGAEAVGDDEDGLAGDEAA